jgi:hypothetical protein
MAWLETPGAKLASEQTPPVSGGFFYYFGFWRLMGLNSLL